MTFGPGILMFDHASGKHQKPSSQATVSEAQRVADTGLGTSSSCDLPPGVTAQTFLFAIGIVLVTVVAFAPSLNNGFVNWDDPGLILDNPHIRRVGWEQVQWMFTSFHMGPYQPLAWLSLALDYSFWGLNPRGYHLTSLLWHVASAISFCVLSQRLLRMSIPKSSEQPILLGACSALSALVFAVHPLRVESVVWVSERRDLLAGFFSIWTILSYMRAVREKQSGRSSIAWFVTSLLLFLAALLSKATTVTLPAVLSVLDFYPMGRLRWAPKAWLQPTVRPIWLEKAPYWLLSAMAGAAAIYGQQTGGAMTSLESYGLIDRLVLAAIGATFYVYKTLVPIELSPLYELPVHFTPWEARFAVAGIAAPIVTILLVVIRRRWPAALTVWLSYLIMLTPVSGLAQTGSQIAADRYTYLSCLGFAILLGGVVLKWLLNLVPNRSMQVPAAAACLVVPVLFLCPLTWKQSKIWHDSETLWRHALSLNSSNTGALINLGCTVGESDRLEESRELFERAIQIHPAHGDAQNNLGLLFRRLGKPELAIGHLLEAGRRLPRSAQTACNVGLLLIEERHLPEFGYESQEAQWQAAAEWFGRALALRPDLVKAINGLGIVHKRLGHNDQAVAFYSRAMQVDPDNLEAHYNLAILLSEQGDEDAAMLYYRRALAVKPGHAGSCNNLAMLLERRGRCGEAIQILREGLECAPQNEFLLYKLCWILATSPDVNCRNGRGAIVLAEQLAKSMDGQNPEVLDVLAAAYAEAGRFAEASETAVRADQLASQQGKTELSNRIKHRTELYQAGRPFHGDP